MHAVAPALYVAKVAPIAIPALAAKVVWATALLLVLTRLKPPAPTRG